MSKSKDIDFETIYSMSEQQQQQAYYTLAKRANQRFRDLEKSGHDSKAVNKAREFLVKNFNRNTFKQSKNLHGIELIQSLRELEKFFNSKTSTSTGIKKAEEKSAKVLIDKTSETFINDSNVNNLKSILKKKNTRRSFFDFLSSQQFKQLSSRADSNQVIEDFVEALNEGKSLDDIMKGYDEFFNTNMTFEQISERRNSGGKLLH